MINRNLPYVYRLTHKETGEFYIGYRMINKTRAHLDIGIKYTTSSKVIKEMGFNNFNYQVIAEFINPDSKQASKDAYWCEQGMIKVEFNDPLCLNKHFVDEESGAQAFRNDTIGIYTHSVDTRTKISKARKGWKMSDEQRRMISDIQKGVKKSEAYKANMSIACTGHIKTKEHRENLAKSNIGKKVSYSTKIKLSELNRGKSHTKETRAKISEGNKGKIRDQSTKDKISKANKGRKHSKQFGELVSAIHSKSFRVISPDGIIYVGSNLKKFCSDHGLAQGSMSSVCRGSQIVPYKGWTGEYV